MTLAIVEKTATAQQIIVVAKTVLARKTTKASVIAKNIMKNAIVIRIANVMTTVLVAQIVNVMMIALVVKIVRVMMKTNVAKTALAT